MRGNTERFFVLTGGPGSGKSTLVDALQKAGHCRSVEAGRGVIQEQVAIGGRAVPWVDPLAFAELMLSWEMRSYHLAQDYAGPCFLIVACLMWWDIFADAGAARARTRRQGG
jgi:predicted ATPase